MTHETPTHPEALEEARAAVRRPGRVVVLSGAGISAESGVPTFRGETGLWRSYRPEELATPEAFQRDPELVWEWYAMRRRMMAGCTPNPGHRAIAQAQARGAVQVVVTQNVDGLHALAWREAASRVDPSDPAPTEPISSILELHGSIYRTRCSRCDWSEEDREGPSVPLPCCPECSAPARPAVVWFGEMLDPAVLDRSFEEAARADVCLVVGTSAVVHPAASLPLATLRAGGRLIEVNPESTPLSGLAEITLRGTAGEVLPELVS